MRAGKAEDGSKHSEACRKRIEAEMRREYGPRMKRAEDKHGHFEEEVRRAKEAIDKKVNKTARSGEGEQKQMMVIFKVMMVVFKGKVNI